VTTHTAKSLVKRALTPAGIRALRRVRSLEGVRRIERMVKGEPAVGNAAGIDFLARTTPISGQYGADRGTAIDRRFIELFVDRHRAGITGTVLEVENAVYTHAFGTNVGKSIVIGISPGEHITLISDLVNLKEIASDTVDCVILTQTLQFVYDLQAAAASVHRVLKPGGHLVMTVPGIQPLGPDAWPHYWSFTPTSARRLIADAFPGADITVQSYGNVLTAMAFLHGLALEELDPERVDRHDPRYPILIGVHAMKPGARLAQRQVPA
jgi:SAM-dependent methyltransferase